MDTNKARWMLVCAIAGLAVATGGLLGCDDLASNTPKGMTADAGVATPPVAMAPPTPAPSTATAATTNHVDADQMAGADAGAPATTALSDGQILQITHFANSGEVAQANVALSMTKDARVKAFAKMMVSDHGDADVHGAEIAKKEGIVLADSPASASLKSGGDAELADLKGRNGTDFDKAYVDAQVKEHQDVLDGIDTKLLPNAKDLELKAYLMEVRVKVAEHLAHARKLQSDLKKTS